MGLGGDKVYDYVGVKLSDLMEMAKADECVKVIVKASDGYSREVSAADARNYDIALVSGYDNGEAIPEEEGGPLKLVFPISDHPELKNTYDKWSWM